MAAQPGRDLLIKLDPDGTGGFQTVAGLRTRRLSLSSGAVDATAADSPGGWRELLGGAGIRKASVTGSGIFRDAAADALVRAAFLDGTLRAWQVVVPGFCTITGPFLLAGLDYAGTHDGEVTFDIALESAGALTVEAI